MHASITARLSANCSTVYRLNGVSEADTCVMETATRDEHRSPASSGRTSSSQSLIMGPQMPARPSGRVHTPRSSASREATAKAWSMSQPHAAMTAVSDPADAPASLVCVAEMAARSSRALTAPACHQK
eukprot:CAMPEP_0180275824 /NCGR_PEP_ID=MMETSP0988-20121125/6042_1 /TAXON_ID=697907 /ORGANISM="non described non described, Strain CCMP2293" /LENGTH=127 /DNA_ID=CAMNT_0022247103 /DNA_START=558 /DNA_END=941 /DNA_ORIENTATION=+